MFKIEKFVEDLQNSYYMIASVKGERFRSVEQKTLKEWRTIYGELCDNVPVRDR